LFYLFIYCRNRNKYLYKNTYTYIDCFGYSIGAISNLSLIESVSNLRSLLTVWVCYNQIEIRSNTSTSAISRYPLDRRLWLNRPNQSSSHVTKNRMLWLPFLPLLKSQNQRREPVLARAWVTGSP